MALTITEASAVFDLLHWLGHHPVAHRTVRDDEAADALVLLARRAGERLQIHVQPDEAYTAIERLAGRLVAAESDGAAQAVCRGIETHLAHNGSLPWPTIRRPYDEWVTAHEAAGERP